MERATQKAARILILADPVAGARLERALVESGLRLDFEHADGRRTYQQALVATRPDVVVTTGCAADVDAATAMRMAHGLQPDLGFVLAGEGVEVAAAVREAIAHIATVRAENRRNAALRASEERLRQLTENTDLVFWMTDQVVNQVVYISPAYERVWGRPVDELLANPGSWTEVIHPDDRPRVRASFEAHGFSGTYEETYRIVRPDGSVRWIHDRAFEVMDETGTPYRVAGVSEDITEKRALEEQLAQAQRMDTVGRLAGGVAHDFNNLLTSVFGHLSLAMEVCADDHAARPHLRAIQDAAELASTLTRQLLLVGRGRILRAEPVDLNRVINRMDGILRPLLGKRVVLITQLSRDLGQILADEGQLEQVLLNLSVNARDAMPDGGTLTLRTSEGEAQGRRVVKLEVEDDGIGMSREVQAHAFEPYFSTKPGPGAGLGLATVHAIVEQSGGRIRLEPRREGGTRARIELPWHSAATVPAPAEDLPPAGPQSATVLVAEDDPMIRRIVGMVLARGGYRVITASDGDEALRLGRAHDGAIELLLTDVVMPGLDGPRLADAMKADRPGLRVVYMSGYTGDTGVQAALDEARVGFLHKPFAPEELLSAVADALAR